MGGGFTVRSTTPNVGIYWEGDHIIARTHRMLSLCIRYPILMTVLSYNYVLSSLTAASEGGANVFEVSYFKGKKIILIRNKTQPACVG